MFNKINARKYRLFFLIATLTNLFICITATVGGIIMLDTTDDLTSTIVLFSIGGIFLILLILALVLGGKRLKYLRNELFELDMLENIKTPKPFENVYLNINQKEPNVIKNSLLIDEEGITFDDYSVEWENISDIEVVEHQSLWFLKVKTNEYNEFLDTHLIIALELVETLISHYYQKDFTNETYLKQVKIFDDAAATRKVFGFNMSIFIQKMIFTIGTMIAAIGLGVLIELNAKGVGIPIASAIGAILIVGVYPQRYKDIPTKSYIIDTMGMGYAEGRKYFYVTWNHIISMRKVGKHLQIQIHHDGEDHEIEIKFNQVFADEIKKINEKRDEKILYNEYNSSDFS